ncbi:unnamed protein product [Brassica oleracea]
MQFRPFSILSLIQEGPFVVELFFILKVDRIWRLQSKYLRI